MTFHAFSVFRPFAAFAAGALTGSTAIPAASNGLLTGLTSFWGMEPGALTADSHGSNDLTMTGTVTSAETSIGYGGKFGAGYFLTPVGILPSGEFSISLFYSTQDFHNFMQLVLSASLNDGTENSLFIVVMEDSAFFGMGSKILAFPAPIIGGTYHLLVGLREQKIRLFVNSVFVGETERLSYDLSNKPLFIGNEDYGGPTGGLAHLGLIDDVALWIGRGPTQEMATALYNNGLGLPYSEFTA